MSYPRVQKRITDLPAYMRDKNAKRVAAAKLLGICLSCNADKAAEGRTKCHTCLEINVIAKRNRRAA